MQSRYYGNPVRRSVEEIRIAECDVLRSSSHLLSDILDDHVALHDTECAVVDRNDRTVTTKELEAARRFRIDYRFHLVGSDLQLGIPLQVRQVAAVRHQA